MKERVQVLCRVKPARVATGCTVAAADTVAVASETDRSGPRSWKFDGVFDKDAKQAAVYEEAGQPILDAVLQGYNGTILAYGQTGSGKTHTLLHKGTAPDEAGLVPRLVAALFVAIGCDARHVYRVKASFAQIYNEQIDDLLKPRNTNLRVRASASGGADVDGLSCTVCKSAEQLLSLFEAGRRHLVYAETKMNKSSSRSHAVLQIKVARRLRVLDAGGAGSYTTTMQTGKLTVVDLAGSERVKKSGAGENETRFREAVNINTSLLGLSNVMKALSQNASFVPYRDSRLTHMLSDALGGNCRTTLIVCASPTPSDAAESVGTLEFGARAMKVRTHAVVNSETVELDAAALAADLSDALRLRAEGGLPGQLIELEAALAERENVTAALRRQASEESKVQRAELEAAREAAEAEGARHTAALEVMRADLREAAAARARAEAAAAREVGEREEMEGRLATRSLELHAQVEDTKLQALETAREAESARADAAALRAERAVLIGALHDADGALSAAAAGCALTRAELADAKADAHSLRSRLELATTAAADAAEAREAERSDAAAEAAALADAHALALASVQAAAAEQGAAVERMQSEMARMASAHADEHAGTVARFDALQAQYDGALRARDVGARDLADARASCAAFKAQLSDEQRRRDAEAKSLGEELSGRSTELRRAITECEAKSRMLSAAHSAHEMQAAHLSAITERAREAEEGLASAEARLAQVEDDLSSTRAERRSLVAEQASLAAMAAAEMAAADECRYAEVQALLAACTSREAALVAERSALEAANAARAVALREAEAAAAAERAEARARADELLGRLQRQAVHGAAAARELHDARGDLSAIGAERSELKAEGDAMSDRLAARDDALKRAAAELCTARAKLVAADVAHARQMLLTGVVATKHGRRGKPHPRLVRCSADLSRLEWTRPADLGGAEPEKSISLAEISAIEPGLQSAVARRGAAGKEQLVLCVLSARRSLDLEFPTQTARDLWLATWRRWRDGAQGDEHQPGAAAAKCISVGVVADSRVATGG